MIFLIEPIGMVGLTRPNYEITIGQGAEPSEVVPK